MAVSESIRKLFSEYEDAFRNLDFQRIAEFFSDTFISAGPNGTIANSKAEYLKLSQQAAAFYRSIGQTSAKIISLSRDTSQQPVLDD